MRDASIAVLREIGVETGGSNVQFAVNPADGRLVVIEMNPRVSRSSALASKATGFPIAKVAAKLAVGYTLDEIKNDITGGATPASFEPTIDYIVTKIPRFAFEKFPGAEPVLTTSMKSVGEAMAIGRTFAESLQKALRSLETGLTGLDEIAIPGLGQGDDKNAIRAALGTPSPDGLLKVAQAMRLGMSDADIHTACRIDPWFLAQIRAIVETEAEIRAKGLPDTAAVVAPAQGHGLFRCAARPAHRPCGRGSFRAPAQLGVRPVFKRIDTCAAEFASPTAYMYSTYETPFAGHRRRRGGAVGQKESHHPRRRPEPHRPRHRVRLLLLPRRLRSQGRRLRNHHGQLQSGDGVDRLRHLRPALFRAAHRRGRDRDHRHRARERDLARRDRAVRRADAAQARRTAGKGAGADSGHLARRHRSGRGPRPLQAIARPAQAAPAEERHRHLAGKSARNRRLDRLSDRDPAVLRARRPRHGDRARRPISSTATWRGLPPISTGRRSSRCRRSGRCSSTAI